MVKLEHIIRAIDENLTKTHDGTSLGPLKEEMHHFAEYCSTGIGSDGTFYEKKRHHHYWILSSDGEYMGQNGGGYTDGRDSEMARIVPSPLRTLRLGTRSESTDMNIIYYKHDNYREYNEFVPNNINTLTEVIGKDGHRIQYTDEFLEKNKDGDYRIRSISRVTTCTDEYNLRKITTLIKNNKFNEENEQDFNNAMKKYDNVHNEYEDKVSHSYYEYESQLFKEELENRGMRSTGASPTSLGANLPKSVKQEIRKKASEKALEDNGTLDDYYKKNGVYKEFEDCNCKLRITSY